MCNKRKKFKATLGVVCMLFMLPNIVFAQQDVLSDSALVSDTVPVEALSLSLSEAQQYALDANKSLKNANLDVRKAKAQWWQSVASMLPQVDGTATYTNMLGYSIDMGSMKIAMPANLALNLTASVAVNGQLVVGALLSGVARDMQSITYAQSASTLRANVMKSYVAILVAQDILSLLDSSLLNMQSLAEQTHRMASVGTVEQTEADLLDVRVIALQNSINANKRSLELAMSSLRVLLGIDINTVLRLTNTVEEVLGVEAIVPLLADAFNINNNFNYQLLEKNVELSKKNVQLAWWAYGPTLAFNYQYSYRKYFSDEKTMNMNPPNMIAITLSIPIFSSGKRAAAVRENKIALEQARNTLQETSDNLMIQNQQLRFNLANAYETYANEKQNLEVTKRVFNNTTKKYRVGSSSALELTNASNDLIAAQSTFVQAILTMVDAQVELVTFLNNN